MYNKNTGNMTVYNKNTGTSSAYHYNTSGTNGYYYNGRVVVNPVYVGPAWGWNRGVVWAPYGAYWGGGFWGPFAVGAATAAVMGSHRLRESNIYVVPVSTGSPGATLLSNYGLRQAPCGPPGLVVIYGPNFGVICANPNRPRRCRQLRSQHQQADASIAIAVVGLFQRGCAVETRRYRFCRPRRPAALGAIGRTKESATTISSSRYGAPRHDIIDPTTFPQARSSCIPNSNRSCSRMPKPEGPETLHKTSAILLFTGIAGLCVSSPWEARAALIYAGGPNANVVDAYPAFDTNPAPVAEITSGLFAPTGMTVDRHGNLYVCNNEGQTGFARAGKGFWTVTVYRRGMTSPLRTYTNGVWSPVDVAVAPDGTAYIANFGNGVVNVYPPKRLDPSRTLVAPSGGASLGVALDDSGNAAYESRHAERWRQRVRVRAGSGRRHESGHRVRRRTARLSHRPQRQPHRRREQGPRSRIRHRGLRSREHTAEAAAHRTVSAIYART